MLIGLIAAVALLVGAAPSSAQTPTQQEKNRRAFFAMHVERQALKSYLSGTGAAKETYSREALALSMRFLARAFAKRPDVEPWKAAHFAEVFFRASTCKAPCSPESSPAVLIAAAEKDFRDPGVMAPDEIGDAPFYLNILSETAQSLTRGDSSLSTTQRIKDPLGAPPLGTAVAEAQNCATNDGCALAFDLAYGGDESSGTPLLEGYSILATPTQLNNTPAANGDPLTIIFGPATGGPGPVQQTTHVGSELKFNLDPAGNLKDKQTGAPATQAQLEQQITENFEDINAASKLAEDEFIEQTDIQLAAPEMMDATPPGEAERQQILVAVAQREALIQNAAATLNLFGDLIGRFDPSLGKQVKITTNAVAQVASGINGAIVGIINLGAQVATGNVFGAVNTSLQLIQSIGGAALGLSDLFGGTQRDAAEDPVSAQLTALSNQLTALEGKLDRRFDRIEQGLDLVFGEVVDGFAAMDARFDQVDAGIADVKESLLTQRFKLDQFERNMRNLSRTAEERRLWEWIKNGLGYRERFGTVMEAGDFNNVIQIFYAHAGLDGHAFDDIALGPDTGPTGDENLLERLSAPFAVPESRGTQLEENVNYIDWLMEQRFGTSVFSQRLPNFRDWALPARAYARMLIEQPERAPLRDAQGSNPDLREIVAVGERVRSNLAALARNKTAFTKVFDNHAARAGELGSALRDVETSFMRSESRTGETPLSRDILYGGPLRRPVSGTDSNLPGCSDSRALATPSNVSAEAFMPAQFLVAELLGLGATTICWSAYWSDPVRTGVGFGSFEEAKLNVEIKSLWRPAGQTAWQEVRVSHYKRALRDLRCSTEGRWDEYEWVCAEPEDVAHADWPNGLKGQFESGATTGGLNTALAGGCDPAGACTGVAQTARAGLDQKQKDLRGALATALATNGSASHTAGRRADGAKALAQSLAGLGLPVALQRDELLRSLLRGDQALIDSELARREITALDGAGFTSNQRDRDPIADLQTDENARLTRLRSVVAGWQDRVIAGTHSETHRLIDSALDELDLARITAYSRSSATGSRVQPPPPAPPPPPPPPPPPGPDVVAPTANLSVPRATTRALASRGLSFFVTVNEPGTIDAQLLMDRKQAKKLRIAAKRQVVVGRGKARVAAAGRVKVVVKLTKKAKARIKRARRVKVTLRTTVTDAAGNRRSVSKRLTLKR